MNCLCEHYSNVPLGSSIGLGNPNGQKQSFEVFILCSVCSFLGQLNDLINEGMQNNHEFVTFVIINLVKLESMHYLLFDAFASPTRQSGPWSRGVCR